MEAPSPTSRRRARVPDAARRAADVPRVDRAVALLRRRRAPGDHGRHRPLLGPRRGRAAARSPRSAASPSSSTAWRAAACPPTTSWPSRARARTALKGADVALVVGVPMDFRLGFGGSLRRGDRDRRDRRRRAASASTRARSPPSSTARSPRRSTRCAPGRAAAPTRGAWVERAARDRDREARGRARRARRRPRAAAPDAPVRASWREVLDRDAIVIGDGGDFVSYAGRVIDSYQPGCWLDPGPVRLPGLRARLRAGGQARPPRSPGRAAARRRRVRLQRDGVRHARPPRRQRRRRDGQQRHLGAREAPDGVPLRLLGRRRPAARRRATTRSSRRSAATASWCATPGELAPALERAFAAGQPALVNVLTDPDVVYPRKSNLA